MSATRLTLRVDFGPGRSIGPGKVRLLEAIDRTGSISQAGRSLGMSYRRAWLLIDDMNRCFRHAVVNAKPGGSQGGGAVLTQFGAELVRDYRAIETAASMRMKRMTSGVTIVLQDFAVFFVVPWSPLLTSTLVRFGRHQKHSGRHR